MAISLDQMENFKIFNFTCRKLEKIITKMEQDELHL